jgi:hypothetical protein
MRAIVEIDRVEVAHANATGGHGLADLGGLVGAVDAIERVASVRVGST